MGDSPWEEGHIAQNPPPPDPLLQLRAGGGPSMCVPGLPWPGYEWAGGGGKNQDGMQLSCRKCSGAAGDHSFSPCKTLGHACAHTWVRLFFERTNQTLTEAAHR